MAGLWDVKSVINKVKNTVMNFTETEVKVREATNNDPWGASSTLMTELGQGTQRFDQFNEIMSTIFKRMNDPKSTWRNIYKSLILMEYLMKSGSEKVVDYCRDHVYDLKILTKYQFIDEKQKDQGINVRQRSKEIIILLENTQVLTAEREKAKLNKNKYIGVGSEGVSSSQLRSPFSMGNSQYTSSETRGVPSSSTSDNYPGYQSQIKPITSIPNTTKGQNIAITQELPIERKQDVCLLDLSDEPVIPKAASDDFADFQSAFPPTVQGSTHFDVAKSSIHEQDKSDLTWLSTPLSFPVQQVPIAFNDFPLFASKQPSDNIVSPSVASVSISNKQQQISSNFADFSSYSISSSNGASSHAPQSTPKTESKSTNNTFDDLLKGNSNLVCLSSLDKYSAVPAKQSEPPSMNSLSNQKLRLSTIQNNVSFGNFQMPK